jgi:hypothetical protein
MEDAYNIAPSFGPTVAEDLGNLSESIVMAFADGTIVLSPFSFPCLMLTRALVCVPRTGDAG